jgi:hypothetical protein
VGADPLDHGGGLRDGERVFFTFYGLNIIHRDFERKLKVDPVGNPGMPMAVRLPDLLTAMPGMVPAATAMMKRRFASHNVATIGDLLEAAAGVRPPAHRLPDDDGGLLATRSATSSTASSSEAPPRSCRRPGGAT